MKVEVKITADDGSMVYQIANNVAYPFSVDFTSVCGLVGDGVTLRGFSWTPAVARREPSPYLRDSESIPGCQPNRHVQWQGKQHCCCGAVNMLPFGTAMQWWPDPATAEALKELARELNRHDPQPDAIVEKKP